MWFDFKNKFANLIAGKTFRKRSLRLTDTSLHDGFMRAEFPFSDPFEQLGSRLRQVSKVVKYNETLHTYALLRNLNNVLCPHALFVGSIVFADATAKQEPAELRGP